MSFMRQFTIDSNNLYVTKRLQTMSTTNTTTGKIPKFRITLSVTELENLIYICQNYEDTGAGASDEEAEAITNKLISKKLAADLGLAKAAYVAKPKRSLLAELGGSTRTAHSSGTGTDLTFEARRQIAYTKWLTASRVDSALTDVELTDCTEYRYNLGDTEPEHVDALVFDPTASSQ